MQSKASPMARGMAIVSLALCATASATVQYTVVNLGTLGGVSTRPTAMNEDGQVVGYSLLPNGSKHAFLYSGGVMNDLGTLGGAESVAYGINHLGQVVGTAKAADGSDRAFFYDGTMHDLNTLVTQPWTQVVSEARGINDSGKIVAGRYIYNAGTMTDMGNLPGHTNTVGYAINNSGQVAVDCWEYAFRDVNHHAVRYSGGTLTDLGTLVGYSASAGYAINTYGSLAGDAWKFVHPFFNHHGILVTGATVVAVGYGGGQAYGINDPGKVVGGDVISEGPGFIASTGTTTDLNTLIDPSSGWWLGTAADINNYGWIVGYGAINGTASAYLLTLPAPLYGDVNRDGLANALDISSFIERVTSGTYQPEADCNRDHVVDALDISKFIYYVTGGTGQGQVVPEPATAGLLALGALALLRRRA